MFKFRRNTHNKLTIIASFHIHLKRISWKRKVVFKKSVFRAHVSFLKYPSVYMVEQYSLIYLYLALLSLFDSCLVIIHFNLSNCSFFQRVCSGLFSWLADINRYNGIISWVSYINFIIRMSALRSIMTHGCRNGNVSSGSFHTARKRVFCFFWVWKD